MKTFSLIITVFLFVFSVFPEEIFILEEANVYGGKTFERIYNDQEQQTVYYSRLIQYFDYQNIIVKVIITTTNTVTINTGVKEQIQYYENGNIVKYEMFLSDEYKKIHGFNRLIEEVDQNNIIIRRIWYNNDILLDFIDGTDNKFQFYNVEFIEDEFLRFYEPNENGDVIGISGKYFSTKSVIKFDTELFDLDSNDIMLMKSFAGSFGLEDYSGYYSKKVRVYSENSTYWLYVQTQLEQFITGQNATIRYYPISRNGELYLICVGFYDIRN